ncbi:hypothetical protein [Mongoliitalea daihaiensis]|uniref:hypothetical protein n=1 Tax=Mongoliitalea daihaiensis TaxID=2782006 RepID=UPI001F1673CF|nr:hypothetical protein [Mongoliitalea daihaiensis]UJP66640.1 hypothetical protein IPZ59_08660 [Mongoliitalea daihaiensis]
MKMKMFTGFLAAILISVLTFHLEAHEKSFSSMKQKAVYDEVTSIGISAMGVEGKYEKKSGFVGMSYSCGFALFSKCETDDQRFEPAS